MARGPGVVLRVTYNMIAKATGQTIKDVKREARAGKYNPRDLVGLAAYVVAKCLLLPPRQ